jgi:hypothetical protein
MGRFPKEPMLIDAAKSRTRSRLDNLRTKCLWLLLVHSQNRRAARAASREDDGHLPDVIVLAPLFDQKRRDVRARDS